MKPIALCLPLLLAACAVPHGDKGQSQQVYGQWQLTRLAQQNIRSPQAVLSIDNANTQFSALTDCNRLFGQYKLDADTQALSFGDIAATRMACENTAIEQLLGNVLPQVRQYRLTGGQLDMLDESGNIVLQGQRVK